MNYKKLISALAIGTMVFAGGVMVFANSGGITLSLGNQYTSIEDELLVDEVYQVQNFESWYWIDDHRIVGAFNQPVFRDEDYKGKMAIYDIETKKMKFFDEMKTHTWEFMGTGMKTRNDRFVLYREEDTSTDDKERVIHLKVYDIKEDKVIALSDNASAYGAWIGKYSFYWTEGDKKYRFTEHNPREQVDEIIKPIDEDVTEYKPYKVLENGDRRELWTVDGNGNIKKLIASGDFSVESVSHNREKLVYTKNINDSNEQRRAVIYDIKEDTKAEVWAPGGWISEWSPDDKYVFIMGDLNMKGDNGKTNFFMWSTIVKAN
jgi:hypothetical protein